MSGQTVSILVPCYRQAHLLPDAVESALAQTAGGVEVIIIDDGSPDDTSAVAGRYVARHPDRVRLVRQENRGLAMARAAGLEASRGEFLVFLDADDMLEPGMVDTCRRAIAGRPDVDLVVGNAWAVGADGATPRIPVDQAVVPSWPAIVEDNPFASVVATMPRAASVRRVGGLAMADLRACEDFDLWIRMVRCGMTVVAVPERLGRTRRVPGSLSRAAALMLDTRIRVLERCAGPDVRLASAGLEPGPPISTTALARLCNGAVFNALGLAVALGASDAEVDGLLGRLRRGAFDRAYCVRQFRFGVQHGRGWTTPDVPLRTLPFPAARVDAALSSAGLPPLSATVALQLRWALNPHRHPWHHWRVLRSRVGRLARAAGLRGP